MKNTRMLTRKRKHQFDNYPLKRLRREIDWNIMVSPSKIRNYLLKDPVLDWFQEFNIYSLDSVPSKRKRNNQNYSGLTVSGQNEFTEFIMNQGKMFESKVYQFLKNNHQTVQVAEPYQARSVEKFKETIEFMKNGIEIIYQGVLHDYDNNIYGCPDLMVRSDRINDIFNNNLLTEEEAKKGSPTLNLPYHYIIIDIKHSTLYLKSDRTHLRNCNSIPAYKGQILMYTLALGTIQGFEPNYGFILGKKLLYTKNYLSYYEDDFMKSLGKIDFDNEDFEYRQLTRAAINWIIDMRTNGHNWRLLPEPSNKNLYPNMKNEKDGNWRKLKNDINNKINEITSVWMCGVKRRNIAIEKNIKSWTDKRCTSLNLEFKPGKTFTTLNEILNINRQKKDLIRVNNLTNNDKWRYFGDDTMEFYIDFETINSNMGQCNLSNESFQYNSNDIIFMIGLGWIDNSKWKYRNFLIKQNNSNSELVMINEFWDFVNKKLIDSNKSESIFFHWSNAEPLCYKKLLERHSNHNLQKLNFYDLYKLFYSNNIVVKGALNFSLKSIAKAMFKNRMITSSWDTSNPCSNGLNAMLLAYKLYKHNTSISGTEPIMKDIIHYNLIDCKVLWEILHYLRNNF